MDWGSQREAVDLFALLIRLEASGRRVVELLVVNHTLDIKVD